MSCRSRACGSDRSASLPSEKILLAQVLERCLDAVIVELLEVTAELIATACAAVEELVHDSDRGVRLTLKEGRAAKVDGAIEIEVVDVVIELADQQSCHGLVADAQHLRACADGSYVLVAPTNFVVETKAGNGCAVSVELHPFGPPQVVAQVLRER